ncbi:MaoC family dehydratase [Sphingosinicella microcystinivorans]|uniref:Acyl dehydratase n=1 Tax=Sphingosinicella microcystinivorans TaxID=335406 RepID=A0AAD1D655_SPHMI|nr:MaoC family dehydratase [Sphingosinicella microcystinivorans]RKS91511.1 acyl dehydratase [Sphingosinicella microcystinivorans]BBE34490.1 enoyl-CoA hydratase [Sphingosinicella microcystinivorans]
MEYDVETLLSLVGQEILVSDWISLSQDEIDAFGRVTRDIDPMHMDPEYARKHSPFGQTVLFGFQTLSMLSHLCSPIRYRHDGGAIGYDLNYGLNRVRFISPVPVNARFRNRMTIKSVEQREDGAYLITSENTIEIEGQERPALVAEWIGLLSREDA